MWPQLEFVPGWAAGGITHCSPSILSFREYEIVETSFHIQVMRVIHFWKLFVALKSFPVPQPYVFLPLTKKQHQKIRYRAPALPWLCICMNKFSNIKKSASFYYNFKSLRTKDTKMFFMTGSVLYSSWPLRKL